MEAYRIGIDVGGTHTDAVILDEKDHVVSHVKSLTTEDVSQGIYKALEEVLAQADISRDKIRSAMLGTTHCTNAIVERKRLNNIAIIRIGAPATLAVKPLIGVPKDLKKALGERIFIVEGGHEFDGREIAPLDKEHLVQIARKIKGDIDAVAITSVFSPVSKEHEEQAARILKEVLGEEFPISLSSEIGSIGLLERENATILNASLVQVAKAIVEGFQHALQKEGVDAQVFFGQNDGTLMSVDYALRYPILTIACGPTNSLRGASYLSSRKDALVVDVGGTTTDIGVLIDSFPRESSVSVDIGGARTNFRMPDLVSIGLGGGTIIRVDENGDVQIGPDSVGYRLTEKALVFGGDTLTATDIAVALGKVKLGDLEKVAHLKRSQVEGIYAKMIEMIELAIDQVKTSSESVPVVLVGGGGILLPDQLQGASEVIKPQNFSVANAIGVAIAQVSGQIERIFSLDEHSRQQALRIAEKMATEEAIQAGADPDSCKIVDIEDVPLSYLPGNATKVKAKVAGSLAMGGLNA